MTPRKLSTALKILDDIPCINNGGCGIAALAIARWGIKHNIQIDGFTFIEYEDEDEHYVNEQALNNNDLESMYVPNHIIVQIDGAYYDSTGEVDPGGYVLDGITENVLLYLLNSPQQNGWNHTFDREDSIPEIESRLGIDLSDVDYDY